MKNRFTLIVLGFGYFIATSNPALSEVFPVALQGGGTSGGNLTHQKLDVVEANEIAKRFAVAYIYPVLPKGVQKQNPGMEEFFPPVLRIVNHTLVREEPLYVSWEDLEAALFRSDLGILADRETGGWIRSFLRQSFEMNATASAIAPLTESMLLLKKVEK